MKVVLSSCIDGAVWIGQKASGHFFFQAESP